MMDWMYEGITYHQNTLLFGAYNVYNVLAAVATGLYFNVSPDKISQAIASYNPQNNRSQYVVTENHNRIVLDAYNANPTSMNLALDEFLHMEDNPKLIILGAMKELGDYCDEEHLFVLQKLQKQDMNTVLPVGREFTQFKGQFPGFRFFESTAELGDYLQHERFSGYTVLIKGSRSNELEKLVQFL